jgi:DNA-directed RNA polymerase specialized sigma24 family protein
MERSDRAARVPGETAQPGPDGERWATKGDEALTALWEREHNRLHRALSLTLGDRDLASDAVDETFAHTYAR